jgi:hypothetical protein
MDSVLIVAGHRTTRITVLMVMPLHLSLQYEPFQLT